MPKIVMEGRPIIEKQDGGEAMIFEIDGPGSTFVRVQSWDKTREHAQLVELVGKHDLTRGETAVGRQKIRVTIEVI